MWENTGGFLEEATFLKTTGCWTKKGGGGAADSRLRKEKVRKTGGGEACASGLQRAWRPVWLGAGWGEG